MQELFEIHKPFYQVISELRKSPGTSLLDDISLHMIYEIVISTNFMPGELAECGCYQGGTAYVIASAMHKSKMLHLFDSFQGVPASDLPEDKDMPEGRCKTSKGYAESYAATFDPYRIIIYEGWFKDTFKEVKDRDFCFVHVDADVYQSTKESIEFFWPRLVDGGWMVFDDYYYNRCMGVNKAVDEHFGFFAKNRTPGCWRMNKSMVLRK